MGKRETPGGGGVPWTWGALSRRKPSTAYASPRGGYVPQAPPAVQPDEPEPQEPDEAEEATRPRGDTEAEEATRPREDPEAEEATRPRMETSDAAQALEDWELAGATVRRSSLPPPPAAADEWDGPQGGPDWQQHAQPTPQQWPGQQRQSRTGEDGTVWDWDWDAARWRVREQ